jgi:hypothetical protein
MNQQTSDFIKKTSPDTLRQHLQDGFGYITIIILSVVYLATSFVTLSPSGKTVQEILIDGFAYAALSLAMDRLFALQGCRNGERDARVVATIAAHGRAVDSVAGWFDRLEDWCERESAAALAKIRAAILSKEGLKYDIYFNPSGEATGFVRDEMPQKYEAHEDDVFPVAFRKFKLRLRWDSTQRQREACYKRAMRCSITPLTPGSLTGFVGKMDDPYDFGSSALERESRGSLTGIISKAATMLVVGYIGVELLEDFSYEVLILRSLQIALSLAMGVIRYYRSYMYVTEEYRGKIIKKIDCLQMFEAAMKREGIKNEHDDKKDGTAGRSIVELSAQSTAGIERSTAAKRGNTSDGDHADGTEDDDGADWDGV